ncbi:MAG: hypothetical protein EZS28_044146, partial [Streblomastix strix]
ASVSGDDLLVCSKTPSAPACSGQCADNTNKTQTECACVSGDKRGICYTCTAKDTPYAECKCPEVNEGDYTKEKCEEDKILTEKEASGSVRITQSIIAVAVVIPILALFF